MRGLRGDESWRVLHQRGRAANWSTTPLCSPRLSVVIWQGCALDVGRAVDQMPSPELAAHSRVIATPHIGGLTPGAIEHQSMETVAQTEALFQGRVPAGAVNAAHAFRRRDLAIPADAR